MIKYSEFKKHCRNNIIDDKCLKKHNHPRPEHDNKSFDNCSTLKEDCPLFKND